MSEDLRQRLHESEKARSAAEINAKVARRIAQAAIRSVAHLDEVLDLLIWGRTKEEIDKDGPVLPQHRDWVILQYPQYKKEIEEFCEYWNKEPRISEEELMKTELLPEDVSSVDRQMRWLKLMLSSTRWMKDLTAIAQAPEGTTAEQMRSMAQKSLDFQRKKPDACDQ